MEACFFIMVAIIFLRPFITNNIDAESAEAYSVPLEYDIASRLITAFSSINDWYRDFVAESIYLGLIILSAACHSQNSQINSCEARRTERENEACRWRL